MEETEFEVIYLEYHPKVVRFFKDKLTIRNPDYEDLANDVMIKVYNNISKFRGSSSLSHWIMCIANNHFKDYLRRKKRVMFNSYSQHTDEYAESYIQNENYDSLKIEQQISPEKELEKDEMSLAVKAAIDNLNKKQRDVIVKFFYEDKDIEKIAEELGIPIGTVKTRLFRARKLVGIALKNVREGIK